MAHFQWGLQGKPRGTTSLPKVSLSYKWTINDAQVFLQHREQLSSPPFTLLVPPFRPGGRKSESSSWHLNIQKTNSLTAPAVLRGGRGGLFDILMPGTVWCWSPQSTSQFARGSRPLLTPTRSSCKCGSCYKCCQRSERFWCADIWLCVHHHAPHHQCCATHCCCCLQADQVHHQWHSTNLLHCAVHRLLCTWWIYSRRFPHDTSSGHPAVHWWSYSVSRVKLLSLA